MYARILVPFDGSDMSVRGLDEAFKLAAGQEVQVRVVYVADLDARGGDIMLLGLERYRDEERKAGQEALAWALARAQQAGVPAEVALLEVTGGTFSKAIVDEAMRWGAEVMVAGTHGRSGLAHLLLGSTAEGLVRATPIPILLVPMRKDASHE